MQSIQYHTPSMMSHARLNVGGMNEVDQLGVCCQQPCQLSRRSSCRALGCVIVGFRPSAMLLLVACHSTGCMYVTFQVQDTHPGSLELLLMYADGADRVMQGTY